jgi:hypothetical protein
LKGLATAVRNPQGQGAGPALSAVAAPTKVTVGDHVVVTVHVRVPVGAALVDSVPRSADTLATGTRLLSAEALRPTRNGDYVSHLTFAFFRPEQQRVPSLAVAFRKSADAAPDTVVSVPVPVTVTPVIAGLEGTLRDIKDIETMPVSIRVAGIVLAVLLLVAMATIFAARWRRRVRDARIAAPSPDAPRRAATPYEIAQASLAELERAEWSGRGDPLRHYTLTADVVRTYLENAHAVPALERTTLELFWALPPTLAAGGGRDALRTFLDEADLVKFAREWRGSVAASAYVREARALVDRWHATVAAETANSEETADVLR